MPGRYAGEWGRLRVISPKNRAGRLSFMALTLIVRSVTRPGSPQPLLRARHRLLYLREAGVGSGSLQSGFSRWFFKEKPQTWGAWGGIASHWAGSERRDGVGAAAVPWAGLASAPGDPRPLQDQHLLSAVHQCSRTPIDSILLQDGAGKET